MRVAVITALNNRPTISRILFNCIDRLRYETEHELHVFAAYTHSDDVMNFSHLCESMSHVENITSKKFNEALDTMVLADYDAFLIMGDDDAISSEYLIDALINIDLGEHHVGMKSNYFFEVESGKSMIHTYQNKCDKLIGAGRVLSYKAVLETAYRHKVQITRDYFDGVAEWVLGEQHLLPTKQAEYLHNYNYCKFIERDVYVGLWPKNAKTALDHHCEMRLVHAGFIPRAIDLDKIHMTDFKSASNIWQYSILENKCKKNDGDPMWFMSEPERDYVNSLRK